MPVVILARMQNIQYQNQFDGIWTCASLLRIPAKAEVEWAKGKT